MTFVLMFSGDNEIRTRDPLLARQVLSQLSYTPIGLYLIWYLLPVGLNGLEPSTSRLSGVRSNQLSYKPVCSNLQLETWAGSHLLSHAVSSVVSSAAYVLTIVFGMGTGVSHKRITTGKLFSFLLTNVWKLNNTTTLTLFLRKEVIQPHLPIRLPCYDFTPVIDPAFGSSLLTVGSLTSGVTDSHGVTGGVYKTRERIHRSILICDY